MKSTEAGEIVLDGVLLAVGWGEGGEVTEVGLMSHEETEYRIEPDAAAESHLADHLRKRVRLWVALRGHRVIRVSRVEVLPSSLDG